MQQPQPVVLLLVAAAVVMSLTACTRTGSGSEQGSPGREPRVAIDADLLVDSRTAEDAPADVRPESGQEACGEVLLQHGQGLPPDARTCFEASIGARAARLVVAHPTTEGDPIVHYYLTTAGLRGYDLVIDQTRDRYSNGTWTRQRCQPASTIDGSMAACPPR